MYGICMVKWKTVIAYMRSLPHEGTWRRSTVENRGIPRRKIGIFKQCSLWRTLMLYFVVRFTTGTNRKCITRRWLIRSARSPASAVSCFYWLRLLKCNFASYSHVSNFMANIRNPSSNFSSQTLMSTTSGSCCGFGSFPAVRIDIRSGLRHCRLPRTAWAWKLIALACFAAARKHTSNTLPINKRNTGSENFAWMTKSLFNPRMDV